MKRSLPLLALGLAACAASPTTLLVQVQGAPSLQLTSLVAQVAVAGATRATGSLAPRGHAPQLPDSLIVVLPDAAADVTVLVSAQVNGGAMISQAGTVRCVPHQRVSMTLLLGGDNADGGDADLGGALVNDLAGGQSSDLGTPMDQGTLPLVAAEDTFARAGNNQMYWTNASDGQAWGYDAANSGNGYRNYFSIQGNHGIVTNYYPDTTHNLFSGSLHATLGPIETDGEVLVQTMIVPGIGQGWDISAELRFTDHSNYYRAYLDGSNLALDKDQGGGHNALGPTASTPFSASQGVPYNIRFQVIGTALKAKAWAVGSAEPAGWMVTATDSTFSSGQAALSVYVNSTLNALVTFTHFQVFKY